MYGGFGVAVAAALVLAIGDPDLRRGVVVAVAVALLGMAFGRLVARLVDGPAAFYPVWFYFWVEVIGGGVLLLALRP